MARKPRKPDDDDRDEAEPFDKFDELGRKLVRVPKEEIDEEEHRRNEERGKSD